MLEEGSVAGLKPPKPYASQVRYTHDITGPGKLKVTHRGISHSRLA